VSERPQGCALVTGASRGIGAATALMLAADGWPVRVNYRSDEAGAKRTVEAIMPTNHSRADLSSEAVATNR